MFCPLGQMPLLHVHFEAGQIMGSDSQSLLETGVYLEGSWASSVVSSKINFILAYQKHPENWTKVQ